MSGPRPPDRIGQALELARRRLATVLRRSAERLTPGPTAAGGPAIITTYPDGPLLVRGNVVFRNADRTVIDPGRATVALCRCGKSATKPFCDGTHKAINFRTGQ